MLSDREKDIIRSQTKQFVTNAISMGLIPRGTPTPPVLFDLKGRVAGAFYPAKICLRDGQFLVAPRISFNPVLASENWQDFITTVRHEVAHLVDFYSDIDKMPRSTRKFADGRRNMHGKYFKDIMRKLGDEQPQTYHSYKVVSKRVSKRWLYVCGNCQKEWHISTVLHNRIQFGTPRFPNGETRICKCKSTLNKTNFISQV